MTDSSIASRLCDLGNHIGGRGGQDLLFAAADHIVALSKELKDTKETLKRIQQMTTLIVGANDGYFDEVGERIKELNPSSLKKLELIQVYLVQGVEIEDLFKIENVRYVERETKYYTCD